MSDNPSSMYALLVGIDEYASPRISDLGGCVNDVTAVEQLLQNKFRVPEKNIRKLTNKEATHQAIKNSFKEHLIGQAKAWAEAGKAAPAPAFLFHYSGHGAQAPARPGTKPDDLDETLVPHDSRTNEVYDIKDWELGQLLDELTQYSDNVTVLLDCCHSGSGTRDPEKGVVPSRRCEPDTRPQPEESLRPEGEVVAAKTRGMTNESGWLMAGKYVLLAACRDREEANEHITPTFPRHGALTFFLLQELQKMTPERPLTYRELYERLRDQVNREYATQMPQCEGDRDRLVFEGVRPERDVFLTVRFNPEDGYYWVDGGVAHGLTAGSQLHVFPPDTRILKDAGEPLATLQVEEVGAVQSGCVIEESRAEIPERATAVIYRINYGDMQQRLALDIADASLLARITERLQQEDVERYIDLVAKDAPTDFRLEQKAQSLEVQDRTGRRLVAPFNLDQLDELARDLTHLARYRNTLALQNIDNSELAGKIGLAIKKLAFDKQGNPIAVPLASEADQSPGSGQEIIVEVGQNAVFEVTNNSSEDLYITLLNFTHDWGIIQLYPVKGENKALPAGRSLSVGLTKDRKRKLTAGLPNSVVEAHEYLKVIATIDEADFEILQQPSLKTTYTRSGPPPSRGSQSPLAALLMQAMDGREPGVADSRGFGPPAASVEDAWTTHQLGYRMVQPLKSQQVVQQVRSGQKTTWPSYQLDIEAPEGFQGEARILTQRQTTRAAGGSLAELAPPPGLAAFGRLFESVEIGTKDTRSVGDGGSVIELEADDEARSKVTGETPLKLRLPAEMAADNEAMLALAYDGSFFYPVGRPGDEANTVNVEWLPKTAPEEGEGVRTRSLGRTVKLYLFKLAGWEEPSLGLNKVSFVPSDEIEKNPLQDTERSYELEGGQARYRKLRPGELKAGQRVALFVHGFTSETRWMVAGPMRFLEANGLGYDHYLAFDYETFNTHVSENGQLMAEALRDAGFGPEDKIHLDVFAHSMGTMVTRSMVEQHGGEDFVDRCFLAGPPNSGSRLAELKRLVPWVGTLLLNQAGPTPPAVIASWALKKITDDAVGGDDLRPSSNFIKELNAINREPKVSYYILAGRNELAGEAASAWDRLFKALSRTTDVALDTFFGDQHDLVINVQSMLNVRNGKYPEGLLRTHVLKCNHFQYFGSTEGQDKLREWLKPSA